MKAKQPKPTEGVCVIENIKVVVDVSCCDKSTVQYEANFAFLDAEKKAKQYIDGVVRVVENKRR